MLRGDVLVLNNSYTPIDVTSIKGAMRLILRGKAKVIQEDTVQTIRSANIVIPVPSVISVLGFNKVPKRIAKFSKLNVIYRDNQICAYCGKQLPINKLTVDHIIPISRYLQFNPSSVTGASTWENCVCACEICNFRKGNKLLSELGWKLRIKPSVPTYLPHIVISKRQAEIKNWLPFCGFNVRVVDTIS